MTPTLQGKLNGEDISNGPHYKEKCKVELGDISRNIKLYLQFYGGVNLTSGRFGVNFLLFSLFLYDMF